MLLSIYFKEGISTKELAREVLLPVPVIAAIKNELKSRNIIKKEQGIKLTDKGKKYIEQTMKFEGLNRKLYFNIIYDNWNFEDDLKMKLYH